jgi:hypothetical protein
MAVPTAPVVAASLIGGYVVARETGNRALGGAVLSVGGAIAGRQWKKNAGAAGVAILNGIYYGSFGLSHPLAKKIGAWPAVLTAAGVSATAAWLISDRKG